jgi:hypothetical protein
MKLNTIWVNGSQQSMKEWHTDCDLTLLGYGDPGDRFLVAAAKVLISLW